MEIISGGQTGADQAALDTAIQLGLPYGGWLPKGRKTENGPLPMRYSLQELASAKYRDRTKKNILASDGTLIVSFGSLTGGSALTESIALRHDRPCLIINFSEVSCAKAVEAVEAWIERYTIRIMNVAGPRASGEPRIYAAVCDMLLAVNWQKFS